ncbi:hypothetical protein Dimus_035211 [Dionaea muscipula]
MSLCTTMMEISSRFIGKPPDLRRRGRRHLRGGLLMERLPFASEPTVVSLSSTPGDSHRLNVSQDLQRETLEVLEWGRVCKQLSAFTSTSMGRSTAQNRGVLIGRSLEESQRLLNQTGAALALPEALDFSGIEDVSGIVDSMSGDVMTIGELCVVKRTLRSARNLFEQLKEISSLDGCSDRKYPLLEILQNCNFLIELEQKIDFCVDCSLSMVLGRASDELEFIRSERRRNMEILDSLLSRVSHQIFQAGGVDRPLVTKRRSRMCVAIRASHRSLLPDGVILNISSSGATYFMEPKEAVDLNNIEVRMVNYEKDEEHAILSLLTSEIAESALDINFLLDRIQEVDLAVARAGYAEWLNGVRPILNPEGPLKVDIERIQHPILLERCLESSPDEPVSTNSLSIGRREFRVKIPKPLSDGISDFPVPIDIKIGGENNVVIISGPNAGGKTASMKTLGLACIMSKAGMYLPAGMQPKLPWFDLVLADIGDHQSLEQSLSTFSGHILRICKILEMATKETLVLIDEIGSGTDPSEGIALSASILQYLKDRVNLAVVTTHYADLSRLREKDARFQNAAMEFCLETLQPTYQILWGCTGESNALKIARAVGFDVKLIQRAENWLERLVPEKQKERKGLLYHSLMEERQRLSTEARGAASLHSEVMDVYGEIHEEAKDLHWRETALLAKETQQVHEELKVAKSQIENVVQEFENQLAAVKVGQLSSLIKKAESTISSIVKSHRPNPDSVAEDMDKGSYTPQPGEQVLVQHLGDKLATVIEVPKDDDGTFLIQYGKMRLRVDKSKIRAVSKGSRIANSSPRLRKQVRLSMLCTLRMYVSIDFLIPPSFRALTQRRVAPLTTCRSQV